MKKLGREEGFMYNWTQIKVVQLRGLDFLVFMLYCAKLQCSKAEASLYDDIALYETSFYVGTLGSGIITAVLILEDLAGFTS